jgi:hypothetical protein
MVGHPRTKGRATGENKPRPKPPRSGRPGRLPTSAPHGAGRAQFRHPALRATNSPATSRPRPCPLSAVVLVRWDQGSVSLASVPPAVSWPGASFPRRGPSGRFPRFTGTIRRSDSPPPLPPHFVSFAWRYPGRTRCLLPRPPGASARGPELVTRCSRRDLPRRWRGLPGSRGTSVNVPCSPTPAGPRRQAIAAS